MVMSTKDIYDFEYSETCVLACLGWKETPLSTGYWGNSVWDMDT